MSETIVAPAAVKLAIGQLRDTAWPWTTAVENRRPNPMPSGRLIVVRRSGGITPTMVTDGPFLTFECFADNGYDAERLANYAFAVVRAMARKRVDGVQCYRVDTLAGPADQYDADAQRDRYTFSVVAHFRATAV